jgi:hypothetical protein
MQPIQPLLDEASRLSKSFHSWNNGYMYCVFITAVCVAGTFIVQWKAKLQGEALEEANNAVIRAKDEQLKDELAHRDERIAKVKADADVSISLVKAESDQKIAAANKRSDEISAQANRDAEQLRAQNLSTQATLEQERNTRLDLEKSISPRWLFEKITGGKSNIEPLRKFAGTHVVLEVENDGEAVSACSQLGGVLQQAGWIIDSGTVVLGMSNPDTFSPFGVTVSSYAPKLSGMSTEEATKELLTWRHSQGVANKLVDFLMDNGWSATYRPDATIAPEIIKLRVWLKPNSRFFPEELREPMKRMQKALEDSRKRAREHEEKLKSLIKE